MHLRRATDDDIALLEYWDSKPHVIAATGATESTDWHEEIHGEAGIYDVFIAVHDARPIGLLQIMDPLLEPSHYWGAVAANLRALDIWIGEETDLNRGLGVAMMALGLDRCFSPPEITAVIIDPLQSNARAQRFFERIGFEVIGPRLFGEDLCLVREMTRERWHEVRSAGSLDSSFTE